MNLTLVTETFPPDVNGVAMTLHRLVTGLAARGHAIEVIRPRQSACDSAKRANCNSAFTEFLIRGFPLPGYREVRLGVPSFWTLRQRWLKNRPELVHIATEGPLGLSALVAARSLKIPVSSSFHTNFHAYARHYRIRFFKPVVLAYLRAFHNRAACTFVPSVDVLDDLAQSGFEKLHLLGRGVDTRLFNPAKRDESLRAEWSALPHTPVAICVGRLAAEKNLHLVAQTWIKLRESIPDLKLILVGDGPMRAKLQPRYPDIHYAGVRHGEDLARHYASGDLFLFASVTETFGNVITEALASGLVVVAHDYAAGRAHIRDGHNGFLVPHENPGAFISTAAHACARRHDWPRHRAAARESALAISWERVVNEFETVAQGLINTPAKICPPAKPFKSKTFPSLS